MSPLRTLNIVVMGVATAGVIWLARHHQWLYAALLALATFIGWPLVFVWFFGQHMTLPRRPHATGKEEPNKEKRSDYDA
jgi:hypothetical protein